MKVKVKVERLGVPLRAAREPNPVEHSRSPRAVAFGQALAHPVAPVGGPVRGVNPEDGENKKQRFSQTGHNVCVCAQHSSPGPWPSGPASRPRSMLVGAFWPDLGRSGPVCSVPGPSAALPSPGPLQLFARLAGPAPVGVRPAPAAAALAPARPRGGGPRASAPSWPARAPGAPARQPDFFKKRLYGGALVSGP